MLGQYGVAAGIAAEWLGCCEGAEAAPGCGRPSQAGSFAVRFAYITLSFFVPTCAQITHIHCMAY